MSKVTVTVCDHGGCKEYRGAWQKPGKWKTKEDSEIGSWSGEPVKVTRDFCPKHWREHS